MINISLEEAISSFEELNNSSKSKEDKEKIKKWKSDFIRDFPVDDLKDKKLKKEDFIFCKKGSSLRNDRSFCNRLYANKVLSVGNSRISMFGLYIKGGKEVTLTKSLQKYGSVDNAYNEIITEISVLIKAAEQNDFKCINDCKLNRSFSALILSMYFDEIFIPVITLETLKMYFNVVSLEYDNNKSFFENNYKLALWKKDHKEFKEWDLERFMNFVDWLWRNDFVLIKTPNKSNENGGETFLDSLLKECTDLGKMKEHLHFYRLNQNKFRDKIIKKFKCKCQLCLNECKNESLLVASHIKPWAKSSEAERLNENNGLLLCPNHDKLFDQGYISFKDSGEILISKKLSNEEKDMFGVKFGIKIELKNLT